MKTILALMLAILPAATQAATYTLSGSKVTSCVSDGETPCSIFDGATFDGEIYIRGKKLGGLAWRNLVWEVGGDGTSYGLPLKFIRFGILDPLDTGNTDPTITTAFKAPLAGSRFALQTGRRGAVLGWSLELYNGPPDYILTDGLTILAGGAQWSGDKGTLTRGRVAKPQPMVAEAPIPAAGLLLLTTSLAPILARLRRMRGRC